MSRKILSSKYFMNRRKCLFFISLLPSLFFSKATFSREEVGSPFRDRFQSYRQTFRIEPDPQEARRILRNIIKGRKLRNDLIYLNAPDIAENGTIVVALVEGSEVTLKRLRKRHNSVALEPANTNYETRIFGPDQVEIQGKLKGLVRSY